MMKTIENVGKINIFVLMVNGMTSPKISLSELDLAYARHFAMPSMTGI